MRARTLTIRTRLTLWYTASVALALAVFGASVYVATWRTLESGLDKRLREGATFYGERLRHQFGEDEEIGYAVEGLVRKSPFRSLSLEIYGPNGGLLAASQDLGGAARAGADALEVAPLVGEGLARLRSDDRVFGGSGAEVAVVRVVHPRTHGSYTIVTYAQREDVAAALKSLLGLALVLTPLLLLTSGIAGHVLARRSLAPVVAMAAQARRMGADSLSERLDAPNCNDELGQLAVTFNQLFDRIESAFDRMRQFVADASHELRTPVAVIRSEADVALTPPCSEAEAVESLEVIRDEAARMARLVDDMFLLARADSDRFDVSTGESVRASELVERCVRAAERLGASRGVRVVARASNRDFDIAGDRARLEQLVLNLVDNATKYAGRGATAEVAIESRGRDRVAIVVRDDGPGVPDAFRESIFERFVCVDRARTRRTGGSGLGLPIARLIARAHGGDLLLVPSDGAGATFEIRLPAREVACAGEPFITVSSSAT